jgi:hypothetical protein
VWARETLGSKFGLTGWRRYVWRCPECRRRNVVTEEALSDAHRCYGCGGAAFIKPAGLLYDLWRLASFPFRVGLHLVWWGD